MQMDVFGLIGLVIVCAVLCILVRKNSPEQSFALTIACVCVVVTYLLMQVVDVIAEISNIAATAQLQNLDILLKAVGVSIVGQIAADVCEDYGQGSLAQVVSLASRFAILILSLPLFRELLTIALALVG